LLADLLEARRRQASGAMGSFELGRVDLARQLSFPDKLYGRERELLRLREALERVRRGASEGVLLVGEAGIGKSALVQQLRRRAAPGELFLGGKFNQLQGNVPYAAFKEAFRDLIPGLRAQPPEVRDAWRRRLLKALGPNSRVIGDIVPELEELLGPQPAPLRLEPVGTSGRLHFVFQAFVQALASAEHPLVLFLDDLQWADPGSLQLLKALAMDPDSHHVLLVGAYRPRKVGPGHPLTLLLEVLREARAMPLETLELAALELPAITALCEDTFRGGPERARPLAELVLRKTAGNPLFITRFLRLLHQSGLLVFDLDSGTWRWELARLEKVEVTENVVELMMATIRRLPERAQYALKVAACLGDRVELGLLSALVGGEAEGGAAPAVWSLLREGLLLPEQDGARAPRGNGTPSGQDAIYRFAHDRVRQAAYSLLTEDERRDLHYEAARRLLQGATAAEVEERLFAVVDHLHLGLPQPGGEVEGLELAELHLRAGLKAKAASAFGAALVYLLRGVALVPRAQWPERREQVFRLHQEAAECAYFSGDPGLAGELVRTALEHAPSHLEKVGLYCLQVLAHTLKGSHLEGLQWGREGMRLLRMELPEQDFAPALAAELAEVPVNLRGRTPAELLTAPRMEDPEQLACVRLLSELDNAAFFIDPVLFALINTRALNLTLKHGNSPWAPVVYSCHAMMVSVRGGDVTTGHAFATMAAELARRQADPRQECRAIISLLQLNHWRAPLRTSLLLARRGMAAGIAGGDLQFGGFTLSILMSTEFSMGAELARVLGTLDSCLAFSRKSGVPSLRDSVVFFRQAIRALQGRTHQHARFDDDDFDEKAVVDSGRLAPLYRFTHGMLRVLVAYLLGDFDEALRMSRQTEPFAPFTQGSYRVVDFNFATSLTLAARGGTTSEERADAMARIAANQQQLAAWAESCPENFRHKHQLVAAEVARLEARPLDAMTLYDSAIEGAHAEGFLQDEALAHELAGRFYHSLGRKRFAALHLRSALETYARWGAWAKVSLLEEEFPDLKSAGGRTWSEPASTGMPSSVPDASLDLLSLLKASETLVGEVVLDRLMEKLMAVCLEAAGATRGALVLNEAGTLVVRAEGAVSEPVSLEHTPLTSASTVPGSVVEHASATGETLVLADAAHQGRFVADPCVVRRSIKSALAVPIQRQARTVGVLYLENELATRAFTPERVGVLRALSSQLAISLENSQLFEQLKVEVQERRRAEAAVRFLADSGLVLAESLDVELILSRTARLVVPFLADWCMFTLFEEEDRIRMLPITHADPEKEARLRRIQEKYPVDWNSPPGIIRALRTGQPVLRREVSPAVLAEHSHGPEYVELMRSLGTKTAMHVPLIARGKTLGVITLVCEVPRRYYDEADLELAQELARRTAVC
ncbi:AAA family ATPase, partial [Pyxidicoccus xibeiensis]|uniref:AAA family ATPase n=1 Tax=Pyxidicoccus xibeiensis TaxID=2906759 RepID=UPI0020A71C0C